jgi:uncharacterized C2H2 Zn-finger protein
MSEINKIMNAAKKQLEALDPKILPHFNPPSNDDQMEAAAYEDRMRAVGLWGSGSRWVKKKRTKGEIFAASQERKATNLPRIAKCPTGGCMFKSKKVYDIQYTTVHQNDRGNCWTKQINRGFLGVRTEVLVCPRCGVMIRKADYEWSE